MNPFAAPFEHERGFDNVAKKERERRSELDADYRPNSILAFNLQPCPELIYTRIHCIIHDKSRERKLARTKNNFFLELFFWVEIFFPRAPTFSGISKKIK
jgi:hypothetical protein